MTQATVDIRAYRYLKSAHESWYDTMDYDAALFWVNKALAVAPDFIEAMLLKADLLYETESAQEALTLLDDMLASTPDCLEAYMSKVAMLMTLGKHRLALLVCQEALTQAKRSNLMQTWIVPYLFRHKMTLQMMLHRYWAAKETLQQASLYLTDEEHTQLVKHLNRQCSQYRQNKAHTLHKLNVV